ncbi:MAG: MBOAT family protein [Desulfobulbaceae bacterium]|nr:MBOAT family protein [Desulfobulbaceae bacterium]
MIFNSFSFLFLFFPLTLVGFFLLGRKNRQWAAMWIVLASLLFYCFWDYRYLPLLLASIVFNYFVGQRIIAENQPHRKRWLTMAIAINLLLLCFFKYVNFFIGSINGIFNEHLQTLQLIVPIGISFFTFTQISFLVDAYYKKVTAVNFVHYLLFVSYFPYIVAGPVLHHQEMLPQFNDPNKYKPDANNLAAGLTLFIFGLSKKLLLADNLVPIIDSMFAHDQPQFLQAWIGMLAYSFQLYFDFSGYSDMAIGVSRCLGFQLPLNFNSPYKANSISDFWQRWHISLSRFLRNYLYIPLGGNRQGQLSRYRNLLLTMLLGGLWHGANWTFVVWGGLHGLYLCIQHGWQFWMGKRAEAPHRIIDGATRVLTLLAVLIAWCFFRAPNVASALDVLAGMIGANGISLVSEITPFGSLMLITGAAIAFMMPNTNEIVLYFDRYYKQGLPVFSMFRLNWSPTVSWGLLTGLLLALCLLSMERTNDFIYAQF